MACSDSSMPFAPVSNGSCGNLYVAGFPRTRLGDRFRTIERRRDYGELDGDCGNWIKNSPSSFRPGQCPGPGCQRTVTFGLGGGARKQAPAVTYSGDQTRCPSSSGEAALPWPGPVGAVDLNISPQHERTKFSG